MELILKTMLKIGILLKYVYMHFKIKRKLDTLR